MLRYGLLLALLALVGMGSTSSEVGESRVATSDAVQAAHARARADAVPEAGAAGVDPGGNPGTVAVYIDGVRPGEGDVVVWLFRSGEGFPDSRRLAYREVRLPASARTRTVLLDDVPAGPIAVVAFHDKDGGGPIRFGSDGAPIGGAAVAATAGPVHTDFERAPLAVRPGGAVVARVTLRYP